MGNPAHITIGYQDGCLHPLWLTKAGVTVARAFGADAIWVPDHFMGFAPKWLWTPDVVPAARTVHSMDALFDPVPIMTWIAMRFRRPLVGTSVTEPIRRHPMSLAQTFVTLDHISRGRAVLGIGNGLRENTEPYGLPSDERVARLEEALTIIRMLWDSRGAPITFDGKYWPLRDAVFDLPLYRNRPPRLYMGAHFPRMLRMCGRWCDGWLPGQKIDGAEYARRLAMIAEGAESAGRSMDGFVAGQTLLVAMGKSRRHVVEKALANRYVACMACGLPPDVWRQCGLEHPMGEDFMGFLDLVPSRITPAEIDRALAQLNEALLDRLFFMGSTDDILAMAEPLARAGCRHFIVANMGAAFLTETARDAVEDLVRLRALMKGLRRLA
ncbi:MAG TPA: LLM class flavin-dependent oxidoreductase [Candidatus Limnocylindrales bacterium]|nr:LLM class flavin-dependent oxidoreductase [Candidatus Limnocylindrales bacterium]